MATCKAEVYKEAPGRYRWVVRGPGGYADTGTSVAEHAAIRTLGVALHQCERRTAGLAGLKRRKKR